MAERNRVVVAAVNRAQQYEILHQLTVQPDIEVIGPIADAAELLITVGEMDAKAVIIPLEEDGSEPGVCSHLLGEYPRLLLLAISVSGSQVFEFEMAILKREISNGYGAVLNAIRTATAR